MLKGCCIHNACLALHTQALRDVHFREPSATGHAKLHMQFFQQRRWFLSGKDLFWQTTFCAGDGAQFELSISGRSIRQFACELSGIIHGHLQEVGKTRNVCSNYPRVGIGKWQISALLMCLSGCRSSSQEYSGVHGVGDELGILSFR